MRKKKRRTFSAQYKFETVMEGLRGEKSIAQICRERDITDSLYYKWRDKLIAQGARLYEDQRSGEQDAQMERIAQLERLVGKQALEIEILKKAGAWLRSAEQSNGR